MLTLFLDNANRPYLFALWTYTFSYIILVVFLTSLIWIVPSKNDSWNDTLMIPSLTNKPQLKYLFIAIILCMAGLPPFHFFFVKMGVLSYVFALGNLVVMFSLMILLLVTWYAYHVILLRAIPNLTTLSRLESNVSNVWTTHLLFGLFCFLFLGFFFIDEIFFFGAWLSV